MSLDYKEMSKKLDKFMKSKEGKKRMNKYAEKLALEQARIDRVGPYLKGKDFDKIIERVVAEHGEDHRDRCYKKGYEPHSNHKATLLLRWIENNYSPIKVPYPKDGLGMGGMFTSAVYFVKGYYFELVCGQGCYWRIYNNKKEVIIDL